jgi:uncharacterized damage-inducible protein DinB
MSRLLLTLVVVSAVAMPSAAQEPVKQKKKGRESISAVHSQWKEITGYIMQVAEETTEADYAYRPTDDVRSTGEMIAHIAGAQYMLCAAALGEEPRAEDEIESSAADKAGIVKALNESTAYCERAYQQTDAALQAEAELWGRPMTGFRALTMNATHNGEHYGNLVTYLRLQGIVPPSSQRGS